MTLHFETPVPVAGLSDRVGTRAATGGPSPPPMLAASTGAEPLPSTVLVVEDEPMIRLLVCDVLEGAGLPVADAADANAALGLLSALGAGRTPCQVLVTDVNLGAGLDGIALADEVRRNVPGLHVLYITGNPERVLKGGAAPKPRECVLGKPFHVAELVATVQRLVASSAARA